MEAVKSTRELLAEYAVLLNKHGVDSQEAAEFLEENRANPEFVELAELSRKLKAALTAPTTDRPRNSPC
jgi:hypothetical protein